MRSGAAAGLLPAGASVTAPSIGAPLTAITQPRERSGRSGCNVRSVPRHSQSSRSCASCASYSPTRPGRCPPFGTEGGFARGMRPKVAAVIAVGDTDDDGGLDRADDGLEQAIGHAQQDSAVAFDVLDLDGTGTLTADELTEPPRRITREPTPTRAGTGCPARCDVVLGARAECPRGHRPGRRRSPRRARAAQPATRPCGAEWSSLATTRGELGCRRSCALPSGPRRASLRCARAC